MVTSVGIFASFITTFFAKIGTVTKENIESKLKQQLLISSVLMTILLIPFLQFVPAEATLEFAGTEYQANRTKIFLCVASGLWSGLIIGYVTEIYTSNKYAHVINLAEACRMGAASNIILGLALGY
jgi:H+-translocating diphosphatase